MDLHTRIILSCIIFLAATLASAAGTGGGALYIPGYVVALKDVHRAVPLSKVTIFGACLVSVLLNLGRKQPSGVLPLISFELAAILEPFTLLGGILGVLLNVVMSDAQILVCLVAVLSFTTYKITKRGIKQYRTESRLLASREIHECSEAGPAAEEESSAPLLASHNECETASTTATAILSAFPQTPKTLLDSTPPAESPRDLELSIDGKLLKQVSAENKDVFFSERKALLEARDRISWPSVIYLLFDVAVNVLLLLLAGGPVALLCGESWQQLCILFLLSFHVAATFLYGRWLVRCKRMREKLKIKDVDVEHGGLGWVSPRTVTFYPFLSLLAGIAAGSIGIGGGLIKGPLLLEIGLNSLSAVSTANFMIFFTSSANTLQYATLGRLDLHDSLNFGIVAACAGAVGHFCVSRALAKSRRQSYLTLLLAFTTVISMLCMVFSFVYNHWIDSRTNAQQPLTLQHACEQRHRLLFVHA